MSATVEAQTPVVSHTESGAGRLDRRLFAYPLLVVAFLLPALAFWPGILTPDSNQTVYQAAAKFASDWWTAFGSIALRQWMTLELGLGGVYGIALAVTVAGLYLCVRPVLRRVPAAATTILLVGFPPMLAQLSGLSRDAYFLGFGLLAFGAMAALPRLAPDRRRQVVIAAIAAAVVCFLCRQNGIVVVFVVAAWASLRHRPLRPATLARGFGIGALAAILAFGGSLAMYRAFDVRTVHAERFIYVYDMASISTMVDEDQFPEALQRRHRPGWVAPEVGQRELEERWNYQNAITLYPNNAAGTIAFADEKIAKQEADVLQEAWLDAITAHPLEYLWGRVKLTGSQLGLMDRPTDAFIGLLDPNNFGHPMVFSRGYDEAAQVLPKFVGPDPWVPLDLPWTHLLVAIACTAVLWRRARSFLAVGMTIALLLNICIMAALAVAAVFRYTNLGVPVAMILLVHVIATTSWVRQRAGALLLGDLVGVEDAGSQQDERERRD
jgi:hypothetical protein